MATKYKRNVVLIRNDTEVNDRRPRWFTGYLVPLSSLLSALIIAGATLLIAWANNLFSVREQVLELKELALEKAIAENQTFVDTQLQTS
jgi:hypothetical protein